MIKIKNVEKNIIKYHCDCGVIGECMFKAVTDAKVMIIDLQCPMCKDAERLKITRYKSDEDRNKITSEDTDLTWAIVVDNILTEDKYV